MFSLRNLTAAVTLATGIGWAPHLWAADKLPDQSIGAPPDREWAFAVAPSLWGAGLSGDVGLFGQPPVNVDMSFGDIFKNLRFAGMLAMEAHNGTWGLAADFIYVSIADDETITRSIAFVPTALAARVETKSLTATLMG